MCNRNQPVQQEERFEENETFAVENKENPELLLKLKTNSNNEVKIRIGNTTRPNHQRY